MQRIELPEGNVKRRLIAVVVLLVIGGAALGYAIMGLVTPDSGWQAIEADNAAGGPTCAGELTLLYELGGSGSVQAESRAVTAAYSRLCREAYRQFDCRESFDDVGNLCDVNRRPNEAVEVGGGLYAALEAVERSGSRVLYLGPVYERYQGAFTCDDSQLVEFDPRLSPDVAREYAAYAAYARDPQAVRLELLGENKVRLAVSGDYLDFARREGVERFVDFGWTRNAFITDFVAEGLAAEGYTKGSLSSYDGFCRNLDGRGLAYSLPLHSRQGSAVYPAAVLDYRGPMALVSLRDYPVSEMDSLRFYAPEGGERRTPYVDAADGVSRNALPELVGYSSRQSCGEVLLAMLPVYIAEEFAPQALAALKEAGIETLYWEGFTLRCTGSAAQFRDFYQSDGVKFTAAG